MVVPKRQRGVQRSDPRHIARLGRGFRDLKKCPSVQGTNKETGNEIFRIHTKHERVRKKGSQGDEQAAKPASYIRKLRFLSRSSKCRIVRAPVHFIRRSWVFEVMVGERIRMCTLPVVSFLFCICERCLVLARGGGEQDGAYLGEERWRVTFRGL